MVVSLDWFYFGVVSRQVVGRLLARKFVKSPIYLGLRSLRGLSRI
jgi:hypothetical protein